MSVELQVQDVRFVSAVIVLVV